MSDPLATLLAQFPLELPRASIQLLADPPPRANAEPDEVWGTVQLVYFDAAGQVINVYEQSVCLAPHPNLLQPPERVQAAIEAHRVVLRELFTARLGEDLGHLPSDLLHFSSLLSLRKAHAVEEFAQALRAHKRLGRLLGE